MSDSDVHAAWSAWMRELEPAHESLLPYDELPAAIQAQDRPFRDAIRQTAYEINALDSALFPDGVPDPGDPHSLMPLYSAMVKSSEDLVARRQGVNTFFVTINGALLTASGLLIRSGGTSRVIASGVFAVAVAGIVFSFAWHSLIRSFGQLNAGKFQVIHRLEDFLPARIYKGEWEALARGEDPDVYRSFTQREIWVPRAAIAIYIIGGVASALIALGLWTPGA